MKQIKNVHNIPTLPVPDLQETYGTFLEWVKPLVSNEEFEEAKVAFEELISSNTGQKLQDFLIEKAKDNDDSWLADWWMKYAYLMSRGPVTTECNAPISLKYANEDKYNQIQKMAVMFHSTAKTYLDVQKNGTPEMEVKGKPFSLDQLHLAYCSIRNPKQDCDEFYLAETLQRHSVLQFKNRFFKIPVIDENDELIEVGKIYKLLNDIANSNVEELEVGIGHITGSTDRNEMAVNLEKILSNGNNKESYQVIADSIILISYDPESDPKDQEELTREFVHGKTFNRFHGKTITYMILKEKIGMIADHTPIDGGTELVSALGPEYMFKAEVEVNEVDGGLGVEEVQFEFTEEDKKTLKDIEIKFREYVANIKTHFQYLKGVTRPSLKEAGILSADGFSHLAFQLAQLDAWGKIRNTYIAVDVRNFYKGRTECIRPVSTQSIEAIEAIKAGNKTKAELKELIQAVFDEHYKRLKLCQAGKGINRHMLGLQLASAENPSLGERPRVFDTAAWQVISGNPISTSSIFAPITDVAFFEPVMAEGIGVVYVIDNVDKSYISVSAYEHDAGNAKVFCESVEKWMGVIIDIFKG